ncbi:hypothetical protein UY3_10460 [Chelonia mydas]|uniref:Uncharacterized protein n=1 Tax=Chelonia mydas TaxID=8469 RepID=M7BK42_CHEMY|nr:hypothetical protein UY3_10460 [Chelonia mydas]
MALRSSRKQQHVPSLVPTHRGSHGAPHAAPTPNTTSTAPMGPELHPVGAAWLRLHLGARGGTCCCFQELLECPMNTSDPNLDPTALRCKTLRQR